MAFARCRLNRNFSLRFPATSQIPKPLGYIMNHDGRIQQLNTKKMKTFRKIEIRGLKDDLITYLNQIKAQNHENFTYINDKSDEYAMMIAIPKECTATFLSKEIENAIAYIWLVISDDLLYVSNITPNKSGQLTYNQYNSIANKFYEEVIKAQDVKNITPYLSKDYMTIEDLAGLETSGKLKNWINSANPATLNTNPHDFKRWCDFIFTAHLNKSKLTASQLERYLIEDEQFYDEEIVSKIVLEYEYSLDLLNEYDNRYSI